MFKFFFKQAEKGCFFKTIDINQVRYLIYLLKAIEGQLTQVSELCDVVCVLHNQSAINKK